MLRRAFLSCLVASPLVALFRWTYDIPVFDWDTRLYLHTLTYRGGACVGIRVDPAWVGCQRWRDPEAQWAARER